MTMYVATVIFPILRNAACCPFLNGQGGRLLVLWCKREKDLVLHSGNGSFPRSVMSLGMYYLTKVEDYCFSSRITLRPGKCTNLLTRLNR